MKRVDARGLSCPEPVIQTKNAMASKEAEYEVLVQYSFEKTVKKCIWRRSSCRFHEI